MRSFLLILLFSSVGFAQPAEAPTLSQEQLQKIENYELKAEVLSLRISLLQIELQKLQTEANAFFKTLDKEGYRLERQNNSWIYVQK